MVDEEGCHQGPEDRHGDDDGEEHLVQEAEDFLRDTEDDITLADAAIIAACAHSGHAS